MLSWKLMIATERACQNVCDAEEVAAHYNDKLILYDRLVFLTRGLQTAFVS